MKLPALKWLLIISISLNVGILAAVVGTRLGAASMANNDERINLPDYLRLDAVQRQRWAELERGFLNDLTANWREIQAHRESVIRQVFSAAPNQGALDGEQAKIAALQDSQQRRVIRQLLAERDLLDAQQREKLMALLLNRYAQEATEEEVLHRH
ncbi:MAG TPA: periplasmic heavy metal sensor [Noviherbaspirillum sp.]|nr:periplasmic heavy metal sensor [Noviherbaspirillum sp.]